MSNKAFFMYGLFLELISRQCSKVRRRGIVSFSPEFCAEALLQREIASPRHSIVFFIIELLSFDVRILE